MPEGNKDNIKYSFGYFPILFCSEVNGADIRDKVYEKLKEHNIYSRKYFYPITADAACFKNKYKKLEIRNAKKLSEQILALPFYENIEIEDIEEIAKIIIHHAFV